MLTIDEKRVLAQALADFMEGIERADLDQKTIDWCEARVTAIERKLLGG